jgi:hypothetical protein
VIWPARPRNRSRTRCSTAWRRSSSSSTTSRRSRPMRVRATAA